MQIVTYDTIIVGSGAAAYNAADHLLRLGQKNIALVTEGRDCGTSRNAGSDKQTYYKVTLSGKEPDSVHAMAQTLFDGNCMDGDLALCEAALSTRCFFKLVELGVEFPKNRYGEFVGYKTDHDPRQRATSAGPYTSRMMTEHLEKEVLRKGLKILDQMLVIKILTEESTIRGILCLDKSSLPKGQPEYIIILCENIVYATGGPAGIYANVVYPDGHHGSSGLAFEAGAKGRNLPEWQFGLASVNPKWNVSGSYMQVLPRIYSTEVGSEAQSEFLHAYFTDCSVLLSNVFLKGYQWPFAVGKLENGSSRIDFLVYQELAKGRRVFLDYRENPGSVDSLDYSTLISEAYEYLKHAEVCFGTPVERLQKMNYPAYEQYLEKGVDLSKEPLEISLCAQHNNGGLAVDCWWQTNLTGLFAVGEVAGTHGVNRPGGSALNSGQVGSLRAAEYICRKGTGVAADKPTLSPVLFSQIETLIHSASSLIGREKPHINTLLEHIQQKMSISCSLFRTLEEIKDLQKEIQNLIQNIFSEVSISSYQDLPDFFIARDTLIAQFVYTSSIVNYIETYGKSRGSAVYPVAAATDSAIRLSSDLYYSLDDGSNKKLQEISMENDFSCCICTWRAPNEIPNPSVFFENVWEEFRNDGSI